MVKVRSSPKVSSISFFTAALKSAENSGAVGKGGRKSGVGEDVVEGPERGSDGVGAESPEARGLGRIRAKQRRNGEADHEGADVVEGAASADH